MRNPGWYYFSALEFDLISEDVPVNMSNDPILNRCLSLPGSRAALRLELYPGRRYLPPFEPSFLGSARNRELVAETYEVHPDSVIVASDGGSLLRLWTNGWVAPGENVAIFEPTLTDIRHAILATGAYYVDCGRDQVWAERLDHLKLVLQMSVRVVMLADPNFPVGRRLDDTGWSDLLNSAPDVQLLVDRRLAVGPVDVLWERMHGGWTLLCCPVRHTNRAVFALTGPQHEIEQLARLRGVPRETWVHLNRRSRGRNHLNRLETWRRWQQATHDKLVSMGYSVFVGAGPWLFVWSDGVESHQLVSLLGHLDVHVEIPRGHAYRHGVVVWDKFPLTL